MPSQGKIDSDPNVEVDSLDGELIAQGSPGAIPETESAPPVQQQPPQSPELQQPPPRGYRWLSTLQLQPGMVIARPVTGMTGSRATLHLAIGSELTANTIAQVINKGVECIAIQDDAETSAEVHAAAVTRFETRLREIFEPVPDLSCRPLFDALIKYGPL